MTASAEIISATVAAAARRAGFTGGPRTWRRDVSVGVAVLNLQKSQWGGQHYVNFGVYLHSLGDLAAPRAEQCHYYARAETTFSISEEWQPVRWEDLLNSEFDEPDDDRKREIEMWLTEDVLPFLEQIGTDEGLRLAFAQGQLTQALTVTLRKYLGGDRRGDA